MSKKKTPEVEINRKGGELSAFLDWLSKQDQAMLAIWLGDDLWKGRLVGTEVHRQFLLSQKGFDAPKVVNHASS